MSLTNDVFVQTRNSRGAVPVSSAIPVADGKEAAPLQMESFRFAPIPPEQLARGVKAAKEERGLKSSMTKAPALLTPINSVAEMKASSSKASTGAAGAGEQEETMKSRGNMPLLQMAACIKRIDQVLPDGSVMTVNGVAIADVAAFAQTVGPLFAREPFARNANAHEALRADAALDESRDLWASAVIAANTAVTIQEFVSGHVPFVALKNKLPFLVKRNIENPETGRSFSLFFITLGLCPEYAQWLGVPAFVRREVVDGRYYYSFLLQEDEDPMAPVELLVASFDSEITASDYRLLSHACGMPVSIDADVQARLRLDNECDDGTAAGCAAVGGASAGGAAKSDRAQAAPELSAENLLGEDVAISEDELPALRSIVRAMVAAHMRDARVDLFSADEDTGYLAFDSLLSWMWYDFLRGLDVVRIRYCAHCGKAFALVGHRGPDKLFCSLECKNNARNSRTGNRRNNVRQQFREEGATVSCLAKRYFDDESQREGEAHVRACLSTWPTLKHDIDDDIAEHGWTSPMLKRCRDEGLDINKLLTTRRKAELKKLMQGRSASGK